MKRLRHVLEGVALGTFATVAACGGSASTGPGAAPGDTNVLPTGCPQPAGAYLVTGDLVGGDCPGVQPHIQKVEVISSGPNAGCQTIDHRAKPTAGGCTYEETQVCPRPGLNMTMTLNLQVPADAVDLRGTSLVQIDGKPGERCIARYAVRYLKTGAAR
jgi:hypothetical protein